MIKYHDKKEFICADMNEYYNRNKEYNIKFDELEKRMLNGSIEDMKEAQQEFDELFAEYKDFCNTNLLILREENHNAYKQR